MKALLLSFVLILAVSVGLQAQVIGKVTKITPATSTTGTIVLEDTTGTMEYTALRRGEVFVKVSGATTTARAYVYSKFTNKLIWTGLLSGVYVPLAGGNPSTQTSAQKLTYLKANGY